MTDITANVIVSMPSQLFTMARSFKAVANGKIYIGKIDTDPVNPENQIQVYVENEDGSHVPVSQPIIINAAGYPVYNGQIAKFVTVQGHSMAVYDAYGAQQFYFPNVLKYNPDQLRTILEGSIIDSSGDVFGSPVRDFEYFGAVGDGVADDTNAIKSAAAWVTSGNYRQITTREQKIYRVTSTVDFNFANGRGHSILMKSPIRPDDGTGIAFLIQNTRDAEFRLKVDGGGGALVDYTQADPEGAQQAFVIRGTRNCRADIVGVNFRGRVLRIMGLDASSGGVIKQSFFHLDIRTGDSSAVSPGRCGQGFYIQGDNSAWGKIGTAFVNWDEYGSVVEKVADITIDHCEFGANGASGFEFRGVATCHIGNMAGGDETFTNTVLLFRPADDGTQCIGVHVKRIFVLQGKIGIELRGSNGANSGTNPNFTIEDVYAQGNTDYGVLLNGCNNTRIKSGTLFGNGINIYFTRTTRNVRIDADCLSATTSCISCDSSANMDEVYITGRAFGNTGAPTIDLANAASIGHVVFNDYTITAGNGAYNLPVSNLAEIHGGRVSFTGGNMYNTGVAKVVKDVVGFVTRNRGAGSISAGNQTVVINHGLAQQPTEICVTPLSTATGFRVLNITATSFDVRLSSALGGSDPSWTFNWFASCEYH
ncbi:TPA: phage head-binding domain-containing protein [Escherichia coli]